MNYLNQLRDKILGTKVKRNWPIGNLNFDLYLLQMQIDALVREKGNIKGNKFKKELADIIIVTLGIASYDKIDMDKAIEEQMKKNENE